MTLIYEYGDRKERKGRRDGKREGRREGRRDGKREGRREGRREGMKEGMKEIITSLLNAGDTLQEISQKTGKSLSELDKILKTK